MAKKIVNISSKQLKNIIKESVVRILNEYDASSKYSTYDITVDPLGVFDKMLYQRDEAGYDTQADDKHDDFTKPLEVTVYCEYEPENVIDYYVEHSEGYRYIGIENVDEERINRMAKILGTTSEEIKNKIDDYIDSNWYIYEEKLLDSYRNYEPDYESDWDK